MTYEELVRKVSDRTGQTQVATRQTIDALIAQIKQSVSQGERTPLPRLGVFELRKLGPGKGHNPRTGESFLLPEREVIGFRVSNLARAVKVKGAESER